MTEIFQRRKNSGESQSCLPQCLWWHWPSSDLAHYSSYLPSNGLILSSISALSQLQWRVNTRSLLSRTGS